MLTRQDWTDSPGIALSDITNPKRTAQSMRLSRASPTAHRVGTILSNSHRYSRQLSIGAILATASALSWAQGCGVSAPKQSATSAISVTRETVLRPASAALSQGFNLEWTTFQSEFWNNRTSSLEPDLVRLMAVFPGAVYRFPGGSIANYLDLAASIGPISTRPAQRSAHWAAPDAMRFGLAEYYDFLEAVRGRPWIVLNPYGRIDGALPVSEIAASWQTVVDFTSARPPPIRYEIGNEPYFPHYKLSLDEYVRRSQAVIDEVGAKVGNNRLVVAGADIDTIVARKIDFNRRLALTVGRYISEFAQHNYYDGPPGGPSVPNRLAALCSTLVQASHDGVRDPTLWVTEHARWPGGETNDRDWKLLWPKTNDMEAGLGVADYLIALSQMTQVRGAFLHTLAGTKSPWSLFLRRPKGDLVPTALYRVIELLAALSDGGDVLGVELKSTNYARYAGGYDMRASILHDATSGKWTIVAINRSPQILAAELGIPELAKASITTTHRYVSSTTIGANNTPDAPDSVVPRESSSTLMFDTKGNTKFHLPPFSVNVIRLSSRGR
jgi:alpha-L-arabinofuranosidase